MQVQRIARETATRNVESLPSLILSWQPELELSCQNTSEEQCLFMTWKRRRLLWPRHRWARQAEMSRPFRPPLTM